MDRQPALTLDPFMEEEKTQMAEAAVHPKEGTAISDEMSLTEEERMLLNEFAQRIELSNSNHVLQYGAGAQKKIADFSETALKNVKTKNLGEVGEMLTGIVTQLKSFEVQEKGKGFLGIFKKASNRILELKTKYAKVEVNVTKISQILEGHQRQLLKDAAVLDKMYELNKTYFKELSMYILAGKKKLARVKEEELPVLKEKSDESERPENVQAVNDLISLCNRFEKKIYDLELTRMIALQMAPQIRLIQGNNTLMAEKIQSTIVNTIPLWKGQMVLALGIAHSERAAKVQQQITAKTNELLKKNAQKLKTSTIKAAKESERGIVDIETLQRTNQSLISTLGEVMEIQSEGKRKRQEAELELNRIETELKQKVQLVRSV